MNITLASPTSFGQSQVELLAPAGDWDCARAAVENGADAIYFGLDVGFNARARATNFHLDDLPKLMRMLHRQQVRGYVTLNTLVFTDELQRLERHVRCLVEAGVDAVLVQDLGVAGLLRELCPGLEVHASTQMTITSAAAIELAAQLGVRRVVLARELSIKEIRAIASQSVLPLEAFVHGALCVAYSGQCLTSESLGGRSANRGQCAQACRLPYELVCDGQTRDLGEMKYLLSPQDLAGYDYIDQLIAAGVTSLKIEGRLKTPEYVANICQHYRSALEAALAGQPKQLTPQAQLEMELSFSRGFSPGWLEGCDHKRLVPGLSSTKRGVLLGQIQRIEGDTLRLKSAIALAVGDGIVLEGDRLAGLEVGGRIYELAVNGRKVAQAPPGLVDITMQRGSLQTPGSTPTRESRPTRPSNRMSHSHRPVDTWVGKHVWKTDDPQLARRLRASYEGADAHKRVPLNISVDVGVGQPLRIVAQCDDGSHVELVTEHIAQAATKHPITDQILREQLSRLGGSVYRLDQFQANIVGQPMIPLSVLGASRKELIERMDAAREDVERQFVAARSCAAPGLVDRLLDEIVEMESDVDLATARTASSGTASSGTASSGTASSGTASSGTASDELIVLCRSLQQLEHALACDVRRLIADFHDLRQYAQAVRMAQQSGAELAVATLRIHKPGEDGLFRMLQKSGARSWLVRSLPALHYARQAGVDFIADFSLNVANPLTARQLTQWGARRFTLSYDLDRTQLIQLAGFVPSSWMEVVIHQHMPMFHMEHCVFCSTLSPGRNKSDCGRPCDRHDVKLRDRVGMEHVLHADIGCRNTLFNAQAQSAAEIVPELKTLGVQHFRIELLRDAPLEQIQNLIQLYRELLAGQRTGAEVWRALRADNRVGVTRGTLDGPKNPLAIL